MSSVSTAFKVHYNKKLGGRIRPSLGGRTMASGGIDAPVETDARATVTALFSLSIFLLE